MDWERAPPALPALVPNPVLAVAVNVDESVGAAVWWPDPRRQQQRQFVESTSALPVDTHNIHNNWAQSGRTPPAPVEAAPGPVVAMLCVLVKPTKTRGKVCG